MSRATENVAKGVLFGIVTTAGFFEGSIIKSKLGKKVFTLMPGEVALVSLDAFGEPLTHKIHFLTVWYIFRKVEITVF